MAEDTKIQWCHATFNHVRGCTKISEGCKNCYAETLSGRNPKVLGVWGPKGTRVVASEAQWKEPLKWNRRAEADRANWERAVSLAASEYDYVGPYERPRVFCASLADVFEDWRGPMQTSQGIQWWKRADHGGKWATSDHYHDTVALTMQDVRLRLFRLIDATPNLDWLLLTKRPENVRGMVAQWVGANPLPKNVWLGTSVENQAAADERIPHLLKTPAAVRFLSCEPLLGPVDLGPWLGPWTCDRHDGKDGPGSYCGSICRDDAPWGKSRGPLDWVIVGGESGAGARPMHLEWVRGIVKQCQACMVKVFVKQMGARPMASDAECVKITHEAGGKCIANGDKTGLIVLQDKKGGTPSEWPEDLRIREFPEVRT